ncbi:uncharacterized protein LOC113378189 [Ctenocephalides felis]|uniref:uncharacterized protein LOC113378189 n=1 Tax=Ctenocephalides felis TaxID=7515 RepID=UPI000E6E14AF|nr:uncharacterized protein LOC113378189 [Ctenocephalides felis]
MSPEKRVRLLERALREAQQQQAIEQHMSAVMTHKLMTADVQQQYGAEARQEGIRSRSSTAVVYGDSTPRSAACASTSCSSLRSAKSLLGGNSYTVMRTLTPPTAIITSVKAGEQVWQEPKIRQIRPKINAPRTAKASRAAGSYTNNSIYGKNLSHAVREARTSCSSLEAARKASKESIPILLPPHLRKIQAKPASISTSMSGARVIPISTPRGGRGTGGAGARRSQTSCTSIREVPSVTKKAPHYTTENSVAIGPTEATSYSSTTFLVTPIAKHQLCGVQQSQTSFSNMREADTSCTSLRRRRSLSAHNMGVGASLHNSSNSLSRRRASSGSVGRSRRHSSGSVRRTRRITPKKSRSSFSSIRGRRMGSGSCCARPVNVSCARRVCNSAGGSTINSHRDAPTSCTSIISCPSMVMRPVSASRMTPTAYVIPCRPMPHHHTVRPAVCYPSRPVCYTRPVCYPSRPCIPRCYPRPLTPIGPAIPTGTRTPKIIRPKKRPSCSFTNVCEAVTSCSSLSGCCWRDGCGQVGCIFANQHHNEHSPASTSPTGTNTSPFSANAVASCTAVQQKQKDERTSCTSLAKRCGLTLECAKHCVTWRRDSNTSMRRSSPGRRPPSASSRPRTRHQNSCERLAATAAMIACNVCRTCGSRASLPGGGSPQGEKACETPRDDMMTEELQQEEQQQQAAISHRTERSYHHSCVSSSPTAKTRSGGTGTTSYKIGIDKKVRCASGNQGRRTKTIDQHSGHAKARKHSDYRSSKNREHGGASSPTNKSIDSGSIGKPVVAPICIEATPGTPIIVGGHHGCTRPCCRRTKSVDQFGRFYGGQQVESDQLSPLPMVQHITFNHMQTKLALSDTSVTTRCGQVSTDTIIHERHWSNLDIIQNQKAKQVDNRLNQMLLNDKTFVQEAIRNASRHRNHHHHLNEEERKNYQKYYYVDESKQQQEHSKRSHQHHQHQYEQQQQQQQQYEQMQQQQYQQQQQQYEQMQHHQQQYQQQQQLYEQQQQQQQQYQQQQYEQQMQQHKQNQQMQMQQEQYAQMQQQQEQTLSKQRDFDNTRQSSSYRPTHRHLEILNLRSTNDSAPVVMRDSEVAYQNRFRRPEFQQEAANVLPALRHEQTQPPPQSILIPTSDRTRNMTPDDLSLCLPPDYLSSDNKKQTKIEPLAEVVVFNDPKSSSYETTQQTAQFSQIIRQTTKPISVKEQLMQAQMHTQQVPASAPARPKLPLKDKRLLVDRNVQRRSVPLRQAATTAAAAAVAADRKRLRQERLNLEEEKRQHQLLLQQTLGEMSTKFDKTYDEISNIVNDSLQTLLQKDSKGNFCQGEDISSTKQLISKIKEQQRALEKMKAQQNQVTRDSVQMEPALPQQPPQLLYHVTTQHQNPYAENHNKFLQQKQQMSQNAQELNTHSYRRENAAIGVQQPHVEQQSAANHKSPPVTMRKLQTTFGHQQLRNYDQAPEKDPVSTIKGSFAAPPMQQTPLENRSSFETEEGRRPPLARSPFAKRNQYRYDSQIMGTISQDGAYEQPEDIERFVREIGYDGMSDASSLSQTTITKDDQSSLMEQQVFPNSEVGAAGLQQGHAHIFRSGDDQEIQNDEARRREIDRWMNANDFARPVPRPIINRNNTWTSDDCSSSPGGPLANLDENCPEFDDCTSASYVTDTADDCSQCLMEEYLMRKPDCDF